MRIRVLVGILVAACLSLPAAATDHPQEALKLILKQDMAAGKGKAVWVTKNRLPTLLFLPPTSVSGAFVVKGINETAYALLPATNWQTNSAGTLYKFVNRDAPGGPSVVKVAVLKQAKVLKVVAKDSLIDLDDTTQGTVFVGLIIGQVQYCSSCAAPLKDKPGKFSAKGCPPPTECHHTLQAPACGEQETCANYRLRALCRSCMLASLREPNTCDAAAALQCLARDPNLRCDLEAYNIGCGAPCCL